MNILLWISNSSNLNYPYWKKEIIIHNSKIIWVFNYNSFCNFIRIYGLPNAINFNYAEINYKCAEWLVNYCLNSNIKLPIWAIKSKDLLEIKNINILLNNYNKFYGNKSN